MQGELDRVNERIDILKTGLSGIAKRYGYRTVQDFYRAYGVAGNAYADYQDSRTKWKETYGTNAQRDTLHDKLQQYHRDTAVQQKKQTTHSKSKGARQ